MDDPVWTAVDDLACLARDRGVTGPATGIAIMACETRHGAALESADKDFDMLRSVRVLSDGHTT